MLMHRYGSMPWISWQRWDRRFMLAKIYTLSPRRFQEGQWGSLRRKERQQLGGDTNQEKETAQTKLTESISCQGRLKLSYSKENIQESGLVRRRWRNFTASQWRRILVVLDPSGCRRQAAPSTADTKKRWIREATRCIPQPPNDTWKAHHYFRVWVDMPKAGHITMLLTEPNLRGGVMKSGLKDSAEAGVACLQRDQWVFLVYDLASAKRSS